MNDEKREKIKKTMPWIEKYRPLKFDEIVSQGNIIFALRKFIEKKTLPHLLFYGPPGTGKTSTTMTLARELYGDNFPFMVLELNASDERGIEVVRTRIKQFVASKSVVMNEQNKGVPKLVILDEIDAMTGDAQAILRKVIEEFSGNARFCLICNYIKKITNALQSRCTMFRFSPLSTNNIIEKIKFVAEAEKIEITDDGIMSIIKKSNGDMRKILNILQSTSMAYKKVNDDAVNTCLGYPKQEYIHLVLDALLTKSFKEAHSILTKYKTEEGLSLNDILEEIHSILIEYMMSGKTPIESVKKLNESKLRVILDKLRDVEYNLSTCTSELIQDAAFVGVLQCGL